jgi:broad specificity phosphatase PhoE
MSRIILVRHGQTEWNRVVRFRGIIDVPLNEIGLTQARATGRRLASSAVAAVYSSPLSRALRTAEAIAEPHGLRVVPHQGLKDMSFGTWGGLSPDEAQKLSPDLAPSWFTEPHLVRPPGGGTLEEVRARVTLAVQEIVARHENETAVLVAHQLVNRVLCCALIGLDNSHFWRIGQDPCCISIFDHHDGRFDVVTLNDTCHLAGL